MNDINSATGLTGTSGAPATPAQGAAELLSKASKSSKTNSATRIRSPHNGAKIRLEGLAFLSNVSPKLYDDILAFRALWSNYRKVLFDWEMTLPKGAHQVYELYDADHDVVGGYNLTWGISTSKSRLELLSRNIGNRALKIRYLTTIQGRQVLPAPKAPASRHPTFRQG